MTDMLMALDDATATLGAEVWASLQNGTVLVLLTALVLWLLRRRVPAGVHALLWTVALVKFIVPCGPSLVGSFSQGLSSVGSVDAEDALMGADWIFFAKMLILGAYALAVLWLAARTVRRWRGHARSAAALPPAPEAVRALVAGCALRLGVRAPDVRVSDAAISPHVAGLVRPILVLPRWLSDDPAAEEAFVLHELAHLRRRDHWFLLVIALVEIVFFFWPPVGFAARRLRSSREAACDETAVAYGPLCAAAYARSLVGAAARCLDRGGGVVPSAVSSRLEERVDYLLLVPARPRRRVWLGLLVAVWGVWALAGSRAAPRVERCPDAMMQLAP